MESGCLMEVRSRPHHICYENKLLDQLAEKPLWPKTEKQSGEQSTVCLHDFAHSGAASLNMIVVCPLNKRGGAALDKRPRSG